jgi:hypothetical protein
MTRAEHLLWILAEECAEVAQRASKAARFGLEEVQPGQALTNAQRTKAEMVDLVAVWGKLCQEGLVEPIRIDDPGIEAKQEKIEKYLEYSRDCGTLTG